MSVSLPVARAGCAKTAKRIEVLFEAVGAQENILLELDGDFHPRPAARERWFDAAFAKLLWPFVFSGVCSLSVRIKTQTSG